MNEINYTEKALNYCNRHQFTCSQIMDLEGRYAFLDLFTRKYNQRDILFSKIVVHFAITLLGDETK